MDLQPRLAWTFSRAKLTKHENELQYLKVKLQDIEKMTTTDQTWRNVSELWQATLALLKRVEVERGCAVLQCIASDEKLLKALGMAETLYKIKGDVPTDLVMELNDSVGAHICSHAYKYDKLISQELVRIQRVKDVQWKVLTLTSSVFVATMIGAANCSLGSTKTCCSLGTAAWLCYSRLARWRCCSCSCSAAAPAITAARSCGVQGGGARRGIAGRAGPRKRRSLPTMRYPSPPRRRRPLRRRSRALRRRCPRRWRPN